MALVKWALEREEDAAATICRLAYRIETDSELALTARTYATEVREFATRLRRLLPHGQEDGERDVDIGQVSDSVIQSLPSEKAATFLIRFLVQHAETTSDVLQSAGSQLGSREMDMLWRKADRERRKLAGWVRELECQLEARREAQRCCRKPSEVRPRQVVVWM
ncbi:MAG: hypothetical protein AB7J30_17710 [Hyphomicrobium sp.]|uniref:hypothetical protein n=1 Tax=Hyphomicrobium sp. TaxID=82 RepID=UPI003D0C8B5D